MFALGEFDSTHTVRGGPDDLQVRLGRHHLRETRPDHRVIIPDQDPDRHRNTHMVRLPELASHKPRDRPDGVRWVGKDRWASRDVMMGSLGPSCGQCKFMPVTTRHVASSGTDRPVADGVRTSMARCVAGHGSLLAARDCCCRPPPRASVARCGSPRPAPTCCPESRLRALPVHQVTDMCRISATEHRECIRRRSARRYAASDWHGRGRAIPASPLVGANIEAVGVALAETVNRLTWSVL
jgi:hypothetical protein